MDARDIIRLPDPRQDVRIELREVLWDLHRRPHVFMRARLTGWHFQHRAEEPFLLVGDVVSRFVRISPDGLIADAYFEHRLPHAEMVSFGYGRTIEWDFPVAVDEGPVERLERARLPEKAVDPFRRDGG
jgi:hypothetical protein